MSSLLGDSCTAAGVPGAVLAIATDEGVEVSAVGLADVESGEAMRADHQFPALSLTKSMTAALLLDLEREGAVDLSSTITSVVPSLAAAPWAASVTIDQVLANTAGLPAFGFNDTGDGDDAISAYAATLVDVDLLHAPGSRFSYSNCGYSLAGAVIEAVTERCYDDLILERLFAPLPMTDSGSWYRSEPERPVQQHWIEDGVTEAEDWWRMRSGSACGAGTLFVTADDLARYGLAHIDRWPELRQPRADFPGPHTETWARGWANFGWGAGVFGWDGFGPGAKILVRVLTEQGAAVALVTNGSNGNLVYRTAVDRLLRERFGVTMTPERFTQDAAVQSNGTSAVLSRYVNGEADCEVAVVDGAPLRLSDAFGRSLPMTRAGASRFKIGDDFDVPNVELEGDTLTYFHATSNRAP